jgi:outer membrane immunogenic protein
MKKVVVILAAIAAFTGSAVAADLPARTYTKAPVAPVATTTWTGCWISGGGGYGISRTDHDERIPSNPTFAPIPNSTSGADGWLVTAGVGCDYQFNNRWVVGGFVDGNWSDISGDYQTRITGSGDATVGNWRERWAWAVGGRIGYLVAPSVLSYLNAGYTQARFDDINLNRVIGTPLFTGIQLPGQTFDGVFVGGGVEYALDFLPGLFLKSEGRASIFSRKDVLPTCVSAGTVCAGPGIPGRITFATDIDSRRPITYAAKAELVYRFNWAGPVVAKY